MAVGTITKIKMPAVDFFGGLTELPSELKDGLFGFSIASSNITVDGTNIPIGTRCFGVCYMNIAHFVGIANSSNLYMLRFVGGSWTLLSTK